jgi:hypothetical protein|tara:strand:+ start:376 stop:600 length:225 start_codon:yes stop_codon:yes gene_type:complete
MTNLKSFNLSDQALGAVMMALQRSLMEQSDIVPVLKGMDFVPTEDGLVVKNPPLVKFSADSENMTAYSEEDVDN